MDAFIIIIFSSISFYFFPASGCPREAGNLIERKQTRSEMTFRRPASRGVVNISSRNEEKKNKKEEKERNKKQPTSVLVRLYTFFLLLVFFLRGKIFMRSTRSRRSLGPTESRVPTGIRETWLSLSELRAADRRYIIYCALTEVKSLRFFAVTFFLIFHVLPSMPP